MQKQMAEELERSTQLKLQAAEVKLSQTIAAKQLAKAKELETTVGTTALLTDFQVATLLGGTVICLHLPGSTWLHCLCSGTIHEGREAGLIISISARYLASTAPSHESLPEMHLHQSAEPDES